MTVLETEPVRPAPAPIDAEALFREARRHRRIRRILISGVVATVVLAAVLVGLANIPGNRGATPTLPTAQPAFGTVVARATTKSAGASFTVVSRLPGPGCDANPSALVLNYVGTANFQNGTVAYDASTLGCNLLPPPTRIVSRSATYWRYGAGAGAAIPTTAAKPWLETPSGEPATIFSATSAMLYPSVDKLMRIVPKALEMGPTASVGRVKATRYSGTTTLAALQNEYPQLVSASAGPVGPDANTITIQIEYWIDQRNRLVRMTAIEPVFSQTYAHPNLFSPGAQAPMSAVWDPSNPPTGTPHQHGDLRVTLAFGPFWHTPSTVPDPSTTIQYG